MKKKINLKNLPKKKMIVMKRIKDEIEKKLKKLKNNPKQNN